ncbi:MAG: hypothetical protein OEY19_12705 [Gammaproteobacteria bacterium]|nr:hypothetical protein [Gammaproteobacteria bacterium]MDH5630327.1 hypothetical protein [Gammaproteobacteria bacterium]
MKKCIIMTMADPTGYEIYDHLIIEPLAALGWQADTVAWQDKTVNWNDYDLVMIRSPWDYQNDAKGFMQVLDNIEKSSARLDNPIQIVEWNINKRYLAELEEKGVEILPTLWKSTIVGETVADYFEQLDVDEIVIKPCISAGADDTYRIKQSELAEFLDTLNSKFVDREFMVQPFSEDIVSEGEFSLFYFDSEYSHAILKTPKQDDFRVQEEHGGRLLKIEPEALLVEHAQKTLSSIDQLAHIEEGLLYARLDYVRTKTGFALMEAELIEPSLYFNLDPQAPARFAAAVEKRMKRLGVI